MEALVWDDGTKGLVDRQLKSITVNTEKVKIALEELRELLPEDRELNDGSVRKWRMDEVQLTVEISGEGGVKLLGSATVGVSGGITVTFKRSD